MLHRLCPLKNAAASFPSRIAFDTLRFSDLHKKTEEFSSSLEKLGVKPGDMICVLHPPDALLAALFFATWRIGASICPLSLRLPPAQIKPCLDRLGVKLFIDSLCPFQAKVFPNAFRKIPYPAALLFTSGSTAIPKIAVLSLENLLASARPAIDALDLRVGDRWLLNIPLYHVGGLGILLRCILAGASVSLNPTDPKITHSSAVPTQLYRASPVYPKLRALLIGGAPISSYPKPLPCYLSYGLTEMGSLVAASYRPAPLLHCGRPLPNREVRLSLEGEIFVRGGCLFQGYWNQGEIIRPFDQDGWFATGDIGRLDTNGFLAICGRKDLQFISGGENIQPEEIEQALLELPEILEAAVVPIADPEYGWKPAAFAVSRDPAFDAVRMRGALMEKLPKFKIPSSLTLLAEIPKKGLKIDRSALKDRLNSRV